MKADILEYAGDQIKEDLSDIAEKARDISVKVKDRLTDAYQGIERSARKAKIAAEEGVAEARHRIKARPLTSVAVVATGAFAVGLLAGWFVGRKQR
jgi:ElaB/YqjD/DUF883 family membrane-anchored ribosome-binding protein